MEMNNATTETQITMTDVQANAQLNTNVTQIQIVLTLTMNFVQEMLSQIRQDYVLIMNVLFNQMK